MPSVLLTGGAGFIGSHTCVELLAAGWAPVVLDNLANSSAAVIERIAAIAGTRPAFIAADVRDRDALDRVFRAHSLDAVIHFAGLKAVGESVANPLLYYENNVVGTIALVEAMRKHGVTRIVFSSSATVYGLGATMPLSEDASLGPINPYGRTKLMVEHVLRDVAASDPAWRMMLLRYFNPVGAHESGVIGEDPSGIPNNLMPFVCQVAVGRRPRLSVFGGDYPTPDGTGVRDYIHVVDLAAGHVAALDKLMEAQAPPETVVNLGTGRGHTVLEVVKAFEAASGRKVAYDIVARRPGDVAVCYADVRRALSVLGWSARRGLDDMCADAWRWQSMNPNGFRA
ncbi:MAG TPA: UDP-glucose 4-epimerase GalE [Casimicrobiaceae bacterium]|nr:UDP-glucose 4-epimerase GalE [Casimicrobiaceae bacterium]